MTAPALSAEHCLAVLLKLELQNRGGFLTVVEIRALLAEFRRQSDRIAELEGQAEERPA